MRESVIYQEWREEAQQDEARSLVLRLLKRRLGLLPSEVESYINTLALNQLEDLAEALLDFSTVADLTGWLEQLPK
jgi:predicted transposase YdaD